MCLLAIAWKVHPDYPLLVSANRDEFLARPTQAAHFWPDHPQVFAGRDLQGGGTWMGISRNGHLAAVTNIRNPAVNRDDACSRGLLVSDFLVQKHSALDYCLDLQSRQDRYNGYNFIAYDGNTLVYQSNALHQPRTLSPGVYAMSNATLDSSWPKTRSARAKLKQWLLSPSNVEQLAGLLNDRTRAADHVLPKTGVSLQLERQLSSEFIELPEYATRCSTAVIVHRTGRAEYCEISHDGEGNSCQQVIDGFHNN